MVGDLFNLTCLAQGCYVKIINKLLDELSTTPHRPQRSCIFTIPLSTRSQPWKMGLLTNFKFLLVLFLCFAIFHQFKSPPVEIPKLPDTWWGPGDENLNVDKSIHSFEVNFSKQSIEDLKNRLKNTRALTPPLEGVGWTYGISGTFLKTQILDYWLNKYDIPQRIRHLNKYPQFVTNIQGLDIHFVRVKPTNVKNKKIIPLLLLHGWPGSVAEFHKILPMLTTSRTDYDFVFEVIAPSLPGFGFSSSAVRPGLGSAEIAVVLKNLMLRLGFEKYYTQGGDWGAIISAQMAALFPQHVLGTHSNMCSLTSLKTFLKTIVYDFFPSLLLPKEDQHLMFPLWKHMKERLIETGYFHIQATKPDTVGVGMNDSPAALAAYVLEKFSTATDRANRDVDDGKLFEKFTPDELIDNLMIYWMSGSMTTAMRIYAESMGSPTSRAALTWPIEIPSACAQFPHEIVYYPPSFLKERFHNLQQVTRMPRGGHFAALEEPELLSNDIWSFVFIVENINKTVPDDKSEL